MLHLHADSAFSPRTLHCVVAIPSSFTVCLIDATMGASKAIYGYTLKKHPSESVADLAPQVKHRHLGYNKL